MKKSLAPILSLFLIFLSFSCTLLNNDVGSISFQLPDLSTTRNSTSDPTAEIKPIPYSIKITAVKGYFSKTITTTDTKVKIDNLPTGEYEIIVSQTDDSITTLLEGKGNAKVIPNDSVPVQIILKEYLKPIYIKKNSAPSDGEKGTKNNPYNSINSALNLISQKDYNRITFYIDGEFNEQINLENIKTKNIFIQKAPTATQNPKIIAPPNDNSRPTSVKKPAFILNNNNANVVFNNVDFVCEDRIEDVTYNSVLNIEKGSCSIINSNFNLVETHPVGAISVYPLGKLKLGENINIPASSGIMLFITQPKEPTQHPLPIIKVIKPLTNRSPIQVALEMQEGTPKIIESESNINLSEQIPKFSLQNPDPYYPDSPMNDYTISSEGKVIKTKTALMVNVDQEITNYSCTVDGNTYDNLGQLYVNTPKQIQIPSTTIKDTYVPVLFDIGKTYTVKLNLQPKTGSSIEQIHEIKIEDLGENHPVIYVNTIFDYYVNPTTGNDDTATGTEASPFKTLNKAVDAITAKTVPNTLKENTPFNIKFKCDGNFTISNTATTTVNTPAHINISAVNGAVVTVQNKLSAPILEINHKDAVVSCYKGITFKGNADKNGLVKVTQGLLVLNQNCSIQAQDGGTVSNNSNYGIYLGEKGVLQLNGDTNNEQIDFNFNYPIYMKNGSYIITNFYSNKYQTNRIKLALDEKFDITKTIIKNNSGTTLTESQTDTFEIVSNDGFVRFINTEGVVEVYNSVTSAIELVNNAGSAPKNIRVAVMPEDTGETPETSKYLQLKSAITADKNITLNLYDPYSNVQGDFSGMPGLKELVIENCDGWVSSFAGCTKLEAVTIPEKYDSIYANAFDSCTNLQRVTIGTASGNMWQVDNDGIAINIDVSNPITNKKYLLGQYKAYTWTQKNHNIM